MVLPGPRHIDLDVCHDQKMRINFSDTAHEGKYDTVPRSPSRFLRLVFGRLLIVS